MMKKMLQNNRAIFATYPIAVFVFFALLLGVSVYMNSVYDVSHDEIQDPTYIANSLQKDEKVRAIVAKRNDPITRVIYQPVKKNDAQELVLANAHSAIILDAESGTIMWDKNSTERRAIASMTKLVTAMVVIDQVRNLDEIVTIPESVMSIEGTKVGCPTSVICNSPRLQVGEKVRIRDLLQATLMYSANDAATILGIHISGSEENFASLMNVRMKELGAANSHFCRPSGLELDVNEESCYSSAYDIARVVAHLLQHDKYNVLWDIMRTNEATFTSVDGDITHELKNTDRLIGDMPNLIGAKTGFTPRAGYCLVLAATDQTKKHEVITVVLDDIHRFDDVQVMSQWAFDNYTWR